MTERLRCVVPGCRRTHAMIDDPILGPSTEWICAKHWPATQPLARRLYALRRRRLRAILVGNPIAEVSDLVRPFNRLWGTLKRQAIEAATGIG